MEREATIAFRGGVTHDVATGICSRGFMQIREWAREEFRNLSSAAFSVCGHKSQQIHGIHLFSCRFAVLFALQSAAARAKQTGVASSGWRKAMLARWISGRRDLKVIDFIQ